MRTYLDPETIPNHHLPLGVMRRLRALAWMGHDPAVVAVTYHADVCLLRDLCKNGHRGRYQPGRHEFPLDVWYAVDTAYNDLSMSFGSSTYYRDLAERSKWAPPLAWDDEALDDPTRGSARTVRPQPPATFDPAVVWRRINGDHTVFMRSEDQREAVRVLYRLHMSDLQIADTLGMWVRQVARVRRHLGFEARKVDAGNMNNTHTAGLLSRAKLSGTGARETRHERRQRQRAREAAERDLEVA